MLYSGGLATERPVTQGVLVHSILHVNVLDEDNRRLVSQTLAGIHLTDQTVPGRAMYNV